MTYQDDDKEHTGATLSDLKDAIWARSLTSLMIGVVHNIKSPITAMMMNLELLSDSLATGQGNEDDARLRYLTIIKSELERLNGLIGNLHRQTLNNDAKPQEFDLARKIEDLNCLLRPQASSQKVSIKFDKPDYPVLLTGNKSELKQAILNILLNALEVMPNGGVISISLNRMNEEVQLEIADTGPGIPQSIINRIFDLHFTTKPAGKGVGLYVSRQLIEKQGGRIKVSSRKEGGARFKIALGLTPEGKAISRDDGVSPESALQAS